MTTTVHQAPEPTVQTRPPDEFIAAKRAERLATVQSAAPSRASIFCFFYAGIPASFAAA
jgi:hypothetical protein